MEVPFLELKKQHRGLKGGEHVKGFEMEFAHACNVDYCVTVNSGTDALRFIFIALGLEPGEEVITVPNTFIATTEAISQAGGTFTFVDIDSGTYNMDHNQIEVAITKRTRGIVPVHLYGQTADMDPILKIARKHNLWVVEDACQAHLAEYKGRKAGSMGNAGAFSFYPGKNLGACGEAGAVTTNDEYLAQKVRMLRDHGQSKKYFHDVEGFNGRCDALQAAALRAKLKHLPEWTEKRRNNALLYISFLSECSQIVLPAAHSDCLHVYHLFVIQTEHREAVQEKLGGRGISTGLHYPVPLHLQAAYRDKRHERGSFPATEAYTKKLLSLPMFPELTVEQIRYVCGNLKDIVKSL